MRATLYAEPSITMPDQSSFIIRNRVFDSRKSSTPNSTNVRKPYVQVADQPLNDPVVAELRENPEFGLMQGAQRTTRLGGVREPLTEQ